LLNPQLWRFSRRGVALGVAIGIFFGFLMPLAQIPASAIAATLFRANIPIALGSTLITNPVTFAPIYVVAYKVGIVLLGTTPNKNSIEQVSKGITPTDLSNSNEQKKIDRGIVENFLNVSKPLALGLGIFALVGGFGTYVTILWFWWLWIKLKRKRRTSLWIKLKRKRRTSKNKGSNN
jgi:uncharacterized protein (DUF2062 family)